MSIRQSKFNQDSIEDEEHISTLEAIFKMETKMFQTSFHHRVNQCENIEWDTSNYEIKLYFTAVEAKMHTSPLTLTFAMIGEYGPVARYVVRDFLLQTYNAKTGSSFRFRAYDVGQVEQINLTVNAESSDPIGIEKLSIEKYFEMEPVTVVADKEMKYKQYMSFFINSDEISSEPNFVVQIELGDVCGFFDDQDGLFVRLGSTDGSQSKRYYLCKSNGEKFFSSNTIEIFNLMSPEMDREFGSISFMDLELETEFETTAIFIHKICVYEVRNDVASLFPVRRWIGKCRGDNRNRLHLNIGELAGYRTARPILNEAVKDELDAYRISLIILERIIPQAQCIGFVCINGHDNRKRFAAPLINSLTNPKPFMSNQRDDFIVFMPEIENIASLTIVMKFKNNNDAVLLGSVSIRLNGQEPSQLFVFNEWLGKRAEVESQECTVRKIENLGIIPNAYSRLMKDALGVINDSIKTTSSGSTDDLSNRIDNPVSTEPLTIYKMFVRTGLNGFNDRIPLMRVYIIGTSTISPLVLLRISSNNEYAFQSNQNDEFIFVCPTIKEITWLFIGYQDLSESTWNLDEVNIQDIVNRSSCKFTMNIEMKDSGNGVKYIFRRGKSHVLEPQIPDEKLTIMPGVSIFASEEIEKEAIAKANRCSFEGQSKKGKINHYTLTISTDPESEASAEFLKNEYVFVDFVGKSRHCLGGININKCIQSSTNPYSPADVNTIELIDVPLIGECCGMKLWHCGHPDIRWKVSSIILLDHQNRTEHEFQVNSWIVNVPKSSTNPFFMRQSVKTTSRKTEQAVYRIYVNIAHSSDVNDNQMDNVFYDLVLHGESDDLRLQMNQYKRKRSRDLSVHFYRIHQADTIQNVNSIDIRLDKQDMSSQFRCYRIDLVDEQNNIMYRFHCLEDSFKTFEDNEVGFTLELFEKWPQSSTEPEDKQSDAKLKLSILLDRIAKKRMEMFYNVLDSKDERLEGLRLRWNESQMQ